MNNFLLNKTFTEHHNFPNGEFIDEETLPVLPSPIYFCGKKEAVCVEIKNNRTLHTNYYIGVDWLIKKEKAVYVEPKLNKEGHQTNYLEMLFDALRHPQVSEHTNELFEIKFDEPLIEIEQQQDLLTPLLVVQFLSIVKQIVRKGLKKSYYKVESNLYGEIKGKVLVGQTLKQNTLKNKLLNTYCRYEVFGLDGLENRLLKKTLLFIQVYLPKFNNLHSEKYTSKIFGYIMPSFESVSEEINLNDIKYTNVGNQIIPQYKEAIILAKLILNRFGYNITNTTQKIVKTPPFWIDMSKLFELYVLGLLKVLIPVEN
jgi:5-methylcytosine-specific restriction enzyme subunit McrC